MSYIRVAFQIDKESKLVKENILQNNDTGLVHQEWHSWEKNLTTAVRLNNWISCIIIAFLLPPKTNFVSNDTHAHAHYSELLLHACRICLHGVPKTDAAIKKKTRMSPLARAWEYGSPASKNKRVHTIIFIHLIVLTYYFKQQTYELNMKWHIFSTLREVSPV